MAMRDVGESFTFVFRGNEGLQLTSTSTAPVRRTLWVAALIISQVASIVREAPENYSPTTETEGAQSNCWLKIPRRRYSTLGMVGLYENGKEGECDAETEQT
jgi:hypothetical protein